MMCEDADYIIIAYGSSARISSKAVELCRAEGIKVGLLRPITLYPFPTKEIRAHLSHAKGMLTVEMSAGQMIEDVRLAVSDNIPVHHYGRYGGMIPSPNEVVDAIKANFLGGK
jgi:2-oxoglutarate ferredoxin oxidoreductase subunit alpha